MNNQTFTTSVTSVVFLALLLLCASVGVAFAAADDNSPIVGTPSITESAALSIANRAYTGDGAFTNIEQEMEKDVLVFTIEYTEKDGNEVDVKVNAKTGAIVLMESDKDEAVNDDQNDTAGADDSEQITNMQTLINLLTQLVALLRQHAS